jgi:hypothetical protein
MKLDDIKDIFSIVGSIATVAGAAAALYWFLFTRSFKRRIEFDADLKIFDVGPDHDYVAELVVIVNNKGQREHRLYNLWCEVRQSRAVEQSENVTEYLKTTNLVPKNLEYFFIPAGVSQTFPKTFTIPKSEKLVRVMAVFTYERKVLELEKINPLTFDALDSIGATTHSVSKLFEVKPSASGSIKPLA